MNLTVSTVSYAAPEQLTGHAIDGRADQYALAGTAFQLLTARSAPISHAWTGGWPPPWPRRRQNAL